MKKISADCFLSTQPRVTWEEEGLSHGIVSDCLHVLPAPPYLPTHPTPDLSVFKKQADQ